MKTSVRQERARVLKKKWPAYGPLLDFYVAVAEAQDAARDKLKKFGEDAEPGDGAGRAEANSVQPRSLEATIDISAAQEFFMELCELAKQQNDHLSSQAIIIRSHHESGALDLPALLEKGTDASEIAAVAKRIGVSEIVLAFLISNSLKPFLEASRDQVLKQQDFSNWKKVHCPVCGAPPSLSVIKGDPALRYSQCSQCSCQWQVDRTACSVCGSDEKDTRSYFHGEGQSVHRIDVCDTCNHYIKTINLADLEDIDPGLEDLASLHLDVVASEKGYKRLVPNLWGS